MADTPPVPSEICKRGPERRAEIELSNNQYSVKRRVYTTNLNEAEIAAKEAVDADRGFKGYHRRTFMKTLEYLNALADQKEQLLKEYLNSKWAAG